MAGRALHLHGKWARRNRCASVAAAGRPDPRDICLPISAGRARWATCPRPLTSARIRAGSAAPPRGRVASRKAEAHQPQTCGGHRLGHPDPAGELIESALLRVRSFAWSNGTAVAFTISFAAGLLSNILWLQEVWHYSALRTGLAITPGPLMVPLCAAIAQRLAQRAATGSDVVNMSRQIGIVLGVRAGRAARHSTRVRRDACGLRPRPLGGDRCRTGRCCCRAAHDAARDGLRTGECRRDRRRRCDGARGRFVTSAQPVQRVEAGEVTVPALLCASIVTR